MPKKSKKSKLPPLLAIGSTGIKYTNPNSFSTRDLLRSMKRLEQFAESGRRGAQEATKQLSRVKAMKAPKLPKFKTPKITRADLTGSGAAMSALYSQVPTAVGYGSVIGAGLAGAAAIYGAHRKTKKAQDLYAKQTRQQAESTLRHLRKRNRSKKSKK